MTRPNVVFVIADQHRWDFMGYEANGVTHTPNLDRLGAEGTIFRSAYCPSPLCCPSRQAIHAGRYGMSTGCFTNPHQLPPHTPSFVQQFRKAGYRTGAVGKTHLEIHAYDADYCSPEHRQFMDSLGWDDTCEISGNGMMKAGINCAYVEYLKEQGKFVDVLRYYENWHYFMDTQSRGDPAFLAHEFPLAEELQETAFVAQSALDWLEQRDRSQPFFLHVGFAGPHSPIEPFPSYMDLYRGADETAPWAAGEMRPWTLDGRRGYRAMITQIDHHIGRVRDCLAAQGESDNTVFVYTADHGEMAGDHGRFGKTCFFEAGARVPLIMAGPGIVAAQSCDALAEIIDVGRTLGELCDVQSHSLDQGHSLVPVLSGQTQSHRDTVYCEMGCDKMLRDERYKLMWGDPASDTRKLGRLHLDKPVNIPPSPCRLYDLQEDSHELHDLAQGTSSEPILKAMQTKLLVRINENTQTQPNKSRNEYKPIRSWEVTAGQNRGQFRTSG